MITVVFDAKGRTLDQYDGACRDANVSADNVPEGLIFHSASATDEGFLVVDVWDSAEKFQAFGERLMPAMESNGLGTMEPKIYPTHNVMGNARVPVTS